MAVLEIISRFQNQASQGATQLKGDFKGVEMSAERAGLQMAAARQQSQLLDGKMNELARAVAKGEKTFDQAEKEMEDYRRTMAKLPDVAEKSSRSFGVMDVALGNLVADGLQKAADAVVEFVGGSIDLASNAAETTSLLENSLGPAAVGFTQDIDRMAEATNRSSIELEAGASTIVAMTRSMGFGQEAAAGFSASMAQIATDLGSFFNQSTEQVFEDIQSALAGSAETMLKYGIDVKETALQQAALRMGLVDTMGPLDRVTRATVLQAEIQRQAADAMGDAERTADSFSNTQRGLEAATLDLQAAIGEGLIPVLYDLIPVTTDVVRGLTAIASANRQSRDLEELAYNYKEIRKAVNDASYEFGGLLGVLETNRVAARLYTEVIRLLEAGIEGTGEELVEYAQAALAADMRAEAMNREFKNSVVVNEDLAEAIEETTRLTVEQSRAITRAYQENHTYEVSAEQVEEAERRRAEAHELAAEAAIEAAEAAKELEGRVADYYGSALPAIENTDSLEYQLYQAAEAAGASATELAELGVGLGLFDEQAANSALQAAAIRIKIDELATAYANGEISQFGMRQELQNFIAVLNGEYTASVGGATETAGHLNQEIGEQKGLVGGTVAEIDRYNKILTGEAAEASATAVTNYGNISASVLDVKLGVDGVIESTETLDGMSVDFDVSAALRKLSELQHSADVLAGKLAGAGGPPAPPPPAGGNGGGGNGGNGGGGGNLPAPEFAEGGFTGFGSGLAGVVHRREFVFNEEATRRLGVGFLESLHTAAKTGGGTIGPPGPGGFFGGIGAPAPPLFLGGGSAGAEGIATAAGLATSPLAGGGGDTIFNISIPVTIGSGASEQKIKRMVGAAVKEALQQLGYGAETRWRIR